MKYVFLILLLASCTQAVAYKPEEVDVPVIEECPETMPEEPKWPLDGIAASATMVDEIRALTAQNELSIAYQDRLRAALAACIN